MNFRPAIGWHPLLAALYDERDGFWLIDGSSIIRLQGEHTPRFELLLALTYHLLQHEMDFLCVFDASARQYVRKLQGRFFAEMCEQLIRTCPRRFSEVPADHTAAEIILDAAAMLGQKIITTDEFRDHAERYPSLESERAKRLVNVRLRHSPRPDREILVWQDVTITVPASQEVRAFVQQYRRLLAERENKPSLAHS